MPPMGTTNAHTKRQNLSSLLILSQNPQTREEGGGKHHLICSSVDGAESVTAGTLFFLKYETYRLSKALCISFRMETPQTIPAASNDEGREPIPEGFEIIDSTLLFCRKCPRISKSLQVYLLNLHAEEIIWRDISVMRKGVLHPTLLLQRLTKRRARIMGLDIGDRYVGIAVSDDGNRVANGLPTIQRK
eukprot:1247144-Amorphochlora_amoeboformis.AAC.1